MEESDEHQATERIRVRVTGRVQGVGFRAFVRSRARSLDLQGWVRNEDDGSVLIVAQGEIDAVRSLLRAVSDGPVGARVDSVVDEPPGEDEDLDRFEIRYHP